MELSTGKIVGIVGMLICFISYFFVWFYVENENFRRGVIPAFGYTFELKGEKEVNPQYLEELSKGRDYHLYHLFTVFAGMLFVLSGLVHKERKEVGKRIIMGGVLASLEILALLVYTFISPSTLGIGFGGGLVLLGSIITISGGIHELRGVK